MLNVIGFDNFIFALLCLMATWSSGTVFGTYSTLQKINAEQHIGIMGTKAPPPLTMYCGGLARRKQKQYLMFIRAILFEVKKNILHVL